MQRRPVPKHFVQPLRVHARDLAGVQVAEPLLELVWTAEGLLHLHLLIEDHPYEERQRVRLE